MARSEPIKLAALDDADLAVISAHVQDAVFKLGEVVWDPASGYVIVPMNRYAWERAKGRGPGERRRAVLQFDRVSRLQTHGVSPATDGDTVLSLLALTFDEVDPPGGTVTMVCSGDAGLRLTVECIEARLTDLGGAWAAGMKPKHRAGA